MREIEYKLLFELSASSIDNSRTDIHFLDEEGNEVDWCTLSAITYTDEESNIWGVYCNVEAYKHFPGEEEYRHCYLTGVIHTFNDNIYYEFKQDESCDSRLLINQKGCLYGTISIKPMSDECTNLGYLILDNIDGFGTLDNNMLYQDAGIKKYVLSAMTLSAKTIEHIIVSGESIENLILSSNTEWCRYIGHSDKNSNNEWALFFEVDEYRIGKDEPSARTATITGYIQTNEDPIRLELSGTNILTITEYGIKEDLKVKGIIKIVPNHKDLTCMGYLVLDDERYGKLESNVIYKEGFTTKYVVDFNLYATSLSSITLDVDSEWCEYSGLTNEGGNNYTLHFLVDDYIIEGSDVSARTATVTGLIKSNEEDLELILTVDSGLTITEIGREEQITEDFAKAAKAVMKTSISSSLTDAGLSADTNNNVNINLD